MDTPKTEKIIDELKNVFNSHRVDNTAYCIAAIYDTLCRKDITLDWLEKSQENGDVALMDIVIVNWMESVRSDPRFKTILAELGFTKFISV